MNTNYMQITELTEEEKIKFYMKLSKKELIMMLINNQSIVDGLLKISHPVEQINTFTDNIPTYKTSTGDFIN